MALELAIPQLDSGKGEPWKIVGVGASQPSSIRLAARDVEFLFAKISMPTETF
jgi:hypothetical protein